MPIIKTDGASPVTYLTAANYHPLPKVKKDGDFAITNWRVIAQHTCTAIMPIMKTDGAYDPQLTWTELHQSYSTRLYVGKLPPTSTYG
jgi:hypothetical protein